MPVSSELIRSIYRDMHAGRGGGLNVTIRRIYAAMYGSEPSPSEFRKVADAFGDYWDAQYGLEMPAPPPVGAGNAGYVPCDDLSPGQANAIRAMEDGWAD